MLVEHYRRPIERPFTAAERDTATILFGGLTSAHDRLIEAVFHACGYRCQRLPTPDLAAFHLGRQYCNMGQCNPTYFTIGNLLRTLLQLEAQGYSRRQIIDQFVFFTAGSCGPCRFGMYESEYRLALHNAGFDGFRVLLFQQDDGIAAGSGEPGLKFTLNFGLGALNAFNLGDVLQDVAYRLRPYEIRSGETDRAIEDCLELLTEGLCTARPVEPIEAVPPWLSQLGRRHRWLEETINCLGKLHFHLYSLRHRELLRQCCARLDRVDLDRTRIKPIVKITGEFWAQTTEGDGNYRMFGFLEHEGAQVLVEPIGTWAMYLLYHAKGQALARKGLQGPHPNPAWWQVRKRLANAWHFQKRWLLLSLGEAFYARQFHRVAQALGGITEDLVSQRELAQLAHSFYHSLSRGGEGHLEVAKNVYYTRNSLCHMVLSLKPFGCMPSSQSDGVQSAVVMRFPGMILLPVETSGEGEVNAHSRAQMALSDAKARARAEFDGAVRATGKRLADIRAFATTRPELQRPTYRVPRRPGVAGVAANFVHHISDLIDGRAGGRGMPLLVGVDVGSTTVKAVALDATTQRIVWQDYQRHEARQPERVLEFLQRLEAEAGLTAGSDRVFLTGSGGSSLAPLLGAKFVQEVAAVCMAVETCHPEVNAVIELGGQDAKIIVFKEHEASGRKSKIPSMNDKCAGGTGTIIDKIAAKLCISPDALCGQGYRGIALHPVAGKCGVFAETDINGLQKRGVPAEELMASLFDAICQQNLTVLARGQTLRPVVLLLGGPNTFIRGMREAWQHNIPLTWRERNVTIPAGTPVEDLIRVPENAEYFGALGAIEFGRREEESVGVYAGTRELERYLDVGRVEQRARSSRRGLYASDAELAAFKDAFARPPWRPTTFEPGEPVRAFIGVDGGSTSTKAVLLSPEGRVLSKSYQLSNGNPIQDAIDMIGQLRAAVESRGPRLEVLGVGTTGYAKDMLHDVLQADTALVETVAHTEAALAFYDDPQVIVDVGGQDIKLILLRDGRITDFKLNTQCSAGNGYFLQATAEQFGVPVDRYADVAFSATTMPTFGYGCAVFLQSDIVNFQRQGWQAPEILAGLAAVLPQNVFLYVAAVGNLAKLGNRFVLQGGTQNNLAVVKAEVDFIRSHFHAAGAEPHIVVHEHCGEAGAIGTAFEAMRLWRAGRATTFIGLDAVHGLTYETRRDEGTRCHFCKNACLRTFVDIQTADGGLRRLIVATCEKGAAENDQAMHTVKADLDVLKAANPNLVEIAAWDVWKPRRPPIVADPVPRRAFTPRARVRRALIERRGALRVGIPRVLYLFAYAPLFSGYLESLGVRPGHIVYSDFTSEALYRAGAGRGAIDPCFPSKVTIAHVHNLLFVKHRQKSLDCIFLPMFDMLRSPLVNLCGVNACPTAAATPDTVKAAFTRDVDLFARNGIRYLSPLVNLSDRKLFTRQMFAAWEPVLGLAEAEHERAIAAGFDALDAYEHGLRRHGRAMIDRLERERRIGIVVLGRPYHHDPGLNHGILEELQKRGYPILSQSTLPLDEDLLERLFGDEVCAGIISHPLDIADVWKNAFSASTNHKIWAAKFTARHPNLVALELSSFKCGHDAPIYTVIEQIIARSGTPYFAFKDIDENKPSASIKIRVETIHYFLTRYGEHLRNDRIDAAIA